MNTKFLPRELLVVLVGLCACNKSVQLAGGADEQAAMNIIVDQQFAAALLSDTTVSFKPPYGKVEEQLTMKVQPPVTTTLTQVARPAVADQFTQGNDGQSSVQNFNIQSAGKLDLILVIDDSSSMDIEQSALTEGLSNLLSAIQGTDWQIVVTTSTDYEPCLRDVNDIKNNTAIGSGTVLTQADYAKDPATVLANFQLLVTPGSGGSGNERTLYGARRALDPSFQNNDATNPLYVATSGHYNPVYQCPPNPWLRSDSSVAILAVTDEDNCHASPDANFHHTSVNVTNPSDPNYSTTGTDTLENGCSASEYNGTDLLTALQTLGRTPGTDARYYGIFWPTGTDFTQVTHSPTANAGWAHTNLVAQTGGAFGSLANPFGPTLNNISADVATILKHNFALQYQPTSQGLTVMVDGTPSTNYTLAGTTLTLPSVTSSNTTLQVSYLHDPMPKFDVVTLSQTPAAATMQVSVNNTPVDPTLITYDEATNAVQFVDMPPDSAGITVNYRTGGALPAVFDLSAVSMEGTPLSIAVGGQAATDATYSPATKALTFASPPGDGAQIAVAYEPVGCQVTRYALPSPSGESASALSMTVTDAETEAPVPATVSGANLVFDENEIVEGRKVNVTYDYGDPSTVLEHELANPPLAGSLQVNVTGGGADCIDNVKVEGTKVTFNCDTSTLGEVQLSYQYVAERYTTFTVDQDLPAGAYVQVFVDGQAVSGWQRSGRLFTVPGALMGINSKVRILASAAP